MSIFTFSDGNKHFIDLALLHSFQVADVCWCLNVSTVADIADLITSKAFFFSFFVKSTRKCTCMHLHKHPRKDIPFHICGKKETPYWVFRCMYESVLSCTLKLLARWNTNQLQLLRQCRVHEVSRGGASCWGCINTHCSDSVPIQLLSFSIMLVHLLVLKKNEWILCTLTGDVSYFSLNI